MADVHQMTDLQSIPFKISPEDKDGKRITRLPAGAVATVTSSDPTVVGVTVDATPAPGEMVSGTLTSGNPGTATVTAHIEGLKLADGSNVPDESIDFEVTNSEPNALNFTVGDARPE